MPTPTELPPESEMHMSSPIDAEVAAGIAAAEVHANNPDRQLSDHELLGVARNHMESMGVQRDTVATATVGAAVRKAADRAIPADFVDQNQNGENEPEIKSYEKLSVEEKREAALFTLASLVGAESEVPPVTDSASFLEFTDLFYPQLRVLAADSANSASALIMGQSTGFITKSAEGRPEAITLRLEQPDTKLQLNLPNPELLRQGNRVWSPDSKPEGGAVLHMNDKIEPLVYNFSFQSESDSTALSNYAESIKAFSEFVVAAETPMGETPPDPTS